MEALSIIGYIAGAFGVIATVAAALIVVKSTVSKTTIDNQEKLIDTLAQRVEQLERSDKEKTATISELKTQVDTFKNIPLMKIVETQEHILSTQKEILKILGKVTVST